MLLIHCLKCQDLIKPIPDIERTCECKLISVTGDVVTGEHAQVGLLTRGQFSFDAAIENAENNLTGKFHGFVRLVSK